MPKRAKPCNAPTDGGGRCTKVAGHCGPCVAIEDQVRVEPQLRPNEEITLPAELMMIFQTARPQLAEPCRKKRTYTAEENYEIARAIGVLADWNRILTNKLTEKEVFIAGLEDQLSRLHTQFQNLNVNHVTPMLQYLHERRKDATEQ
jgi:hypothetical protein